MIAPCPTQVPLARIPAHVQVWRAHHRLGEPARGARLSLRAGDFIRVGRRGRLTLGYHHNRFALMAGTMRLECRSVLLGRVTGPRTRTLSVVLESGRVAVSAGAHPWRALVLSSEMLAYSTAAGTHFTVTRNPAAHSTRAWTSDQLIVAASAADEALRINTRATYTAISDSGGLRLDIWPFSLTRLQRPVTAADGLVPAVGPVLSSVPPRRHWVAIPVAVR